MRHHVHVHYFAAPGFFLDPGSPPQGVPSLGPGEAAGQQGGSAAAAAKKGGLDTAVDDGVISGRYGKQAATASSVADGVLGREREDMDVAPHFRPKGQSSPGRRKRGAAEPGGGDGHSGDGAPDHSSKRQKQGKSMAAAVVAAASAAAASPGVLRQVKSKQVKAKTAPKSAAGVKPPPPGRARGGSHPIADNPELPLGRVAVSASCHDHGHQPQPQHQPHQQQQPAAAAQVIVKEGSGPLPHVGVRKDKRTSRLLRNFRLGDGGVSFSGAGGLQMRQALGLIKPREDAEDV